MNQPHYAVICDMRDVESSIEEYQYCGQIELIKPDLTELRSAGRTRILSTFLDTFFEGYDEYYQRYSMRPWLRRIYPRDV